MKTSHPTGPAAIESYIGVLAFLTDSGKGRKRRSTSPAELLFIRNVQGVEALFQTMSAVGAATPGARDEEWNPLSQRPHSPLPPTPSHALGVEIYALKAAVDAFTTLAHEMMHVALWEPFFTGRWRPRGRQSFTEFSLLAEGYSFFFSDIVVSGAVRTRLPDGEYALERHTSENARFHPIRAFHALGIDSHEEILDIYLEAFCGQKTRLWQPRGASAYAASLAAQVHDFYEGSLLALHELRVAIEAFGGIAEFYRRFCAIPGLPTFLGEAKASAPGGASNLKAYFAGFFRSGIQRLDSLPDVEIARIRARRALQMRAYYALQVRWLISEGLVMGRGLSAPVRHRLARHVSDYLNGLEGLLKDLAKTTDAESATGDLERLDADYDMQVRAPLEAHDAWVASRWMIVPRRAGGSISVKESGPAKDRDAKLVLLRLAAYLIDELTRRMRGSKTIDERAAVMEQIRRVAAFGAAGEGSAAATHQALRRLRSELARPHLRELWSVPMSSFDPSRNRFRELVFSYQ